MTRLVVDRNRLSDLLKKEGGFEGKRSEILFGNIVQAGKIVQDSEEPLGLILPDGQEEKVGFRHFSHRLNEDPKNPYLPEPRVGDRVFLIPFRPTEAKRPYALIWGALRDLPKSCLKTETLLQHLLCALKEWDSLPAIS